MPVHVCLLISLIWCAIKQLHRQFPCTWHLGSDWGCKCHVDIEPHTLPENRVHSGSKWLWSHPKSLVDQVRAHHPIMSRAVLMPNPLPLQENHRAWNVVRVLQHDYTVRWCGDRCGGVCNRSYIIFRPTCQWLGSLQLMASWLTVSLYIS